MNVRSPQVPGGTLSPASDTPVQRHGEGETRKRGERQTGLIAWKGREWGIKGRKGPKRRKGACVTKGFGCLVDDMDDMDYIA
jgi:hypothetical protein